MDYYAHSSDRGEYQMLRDHLERVAELARQYAEAFGAGNLGYLSGMLHDIGKYSQEFQDRVRGNGGKVDHSTAGAQWIQDPENHRGKLGLPPAIATLLAHVIIGHHGGLRNHGTLDESGSLVDRLQTPAERIPEWTHAWEEIALQPEAFLMPPPLSSPSAWKFTFLGRMLYSALVDADTVDTRGFCENLAPGQLPPYPSLHDLHTRFDSYLAEKFKDTPITAVNTLRTQIRDACNRAADLSPRMFSLSVPTGGGKTLSSLSFALRHAKRYGKRRIIYVIPFTSITSQTAAEFRKAVGSDAVVEHHSNIMDRDESESMTEAEAQRIKLSTENWDAPLIITTSVQFFESLYSNKRSRCRKLHNIANSIIIVDEAQSLPRDYLMPCLHALKELTDSYGCSVVLCTATQPVWDLLGIEVTEMMDSPTPEQLMEKLKRVSTRVIGSPSNVVTDDQIVDWLAQANQALCIVNTRRHAARLLQKARERGHGDVYHLSGRMCAKHRNRVLVEIKQRLKDKLPCRVITTQLIEAGVDVDFPIVLRALAGIDSIAQAAGRCNREGRLDHGEVIVFYPEEHGRPTRGWMHETALEALHELPNHEDPLSLACIRNYFERIHGIRSNEVERLTDTKRILKTIQDARLNVPYADIADSFVFIEQNMREILIPYDDEARDFIAQMAYVPNPASILRKLQPYTVQVYEPEWRAYSKLGILRAVGDAYVLEEPGYYNEAAGLLEASETPELDFLLF